MKPNRQLIAILEGERTRSALVKEVIGKDDDVDNQLRALELAHARWVTSITYLHEHKPSVAKKLSKQYQAYKAECCLLKVKPLAPWLYDYEHWVFLLNIGVISIDPGEYLVDRHSSDYRSTTGGVEVSSVGSTEGGSSGQEV